MDTVWRTESVMVFLTFLCSTRCRHLPNDYMLHLHTIFYGIRAKQLRSKSSWPYSFYPCSITVRSLRFTQSDFVSRSCHSSVLSICIFEESSRDPDACVFFFFPPTFEPILPDQKCVLSAPRFCKCLPVFAHTNCFDLPWLSAFASPSLTSFLGSIITIPYNYRY